MKDPHQTFLEERNERISGNAKNKDLKRAARVFRNQSVESLYSYNFSWFGRPIFQYPQDIMAMQEIIWKVQPDVIIETGIAHGGSLIFYASMLALLDLCDTHPADSVVSVMKNSRKVIGVDIDIRTHNRIAIQNHPLSDRIELIEGSSIDREIISTVRTRVENQERILVCLDSNHTHNHVAAELEAYAPLVSSESYCVVFDTLIEEMPEGYYSDRPWDKGNNPMTAVQSFLRKHPEFSVDKSIDNTVLISVSPNGYLQRHSTSE